jgi:hypothetical protein
MTTQYAARHVALGGDDSEPEGLASACSDGPGRATAVAVAGAFQRVFGLVIVGIMLAGFTAAGVVVSGSAWWIVGIVSPGRVR